MTHYKTLSEFHIGNGWPPPENPLFSIVGCQRDCHIGDREFTADAFVIALKKLQAGVILYGRMPYDNNNGSMFFMKPSQIIQLHNLQFEENGFMILIHEDYLHGHELFNVIQK